MGGTGAMGSSLVPLLAQDKNNEIIVTSRRKIDDDQNIHYLRGNAKDLYFINGLLQDKIYDVIVDFMLYSVEEFNDRISLLLKATKHYLFFSSSRVYAETKDLITESSPRLLDATNDQDYIEDFEYSLYKAAEEDILIKSTFKNWTIIRPYKTYSDDRLQLAVFEKEDWALRPLRGKKVVFLRDSMCKYTSLTYTGDVARILRSIIYSDKAFGKTYQIANPEQVTWNDVIKIYQKAYEKHGFNFQVEITNDYHSLSIVFNNKYRIKYDGLVNRKFSDESIQRDFGPLKWTKVDDGLSYCTNNYIGNCIKQKQRINYSIEGYFDRITKEKEPIHKIPGLKNKTKYFLFRYLPYQLIMNNKK